MSQEFIQTDAFTWLKSQGNEFTNFPPGCEGEWPTSNFELWSDEQYKEWLESTYFRTTITQPLNRIMEICMGDVVMNVRGAKSIKMGHSVEWNPRLLDEDNYPFPRTNIWQRCICHLDYTKSHPDIPITYEILTIIDSKVRRAFELANFEKDGVIVGENIPDIYSKMSSPLKAKFAGKK